MYIAMQAVCAASCLHRLLLARSVKFIGHASSSSTLAQPAEI